eukprot:753090-Hanusia_phi.AAC.2
MRRGTVGARARIPYGRQLIGAVPGLSWIVAASKLRVSWTWQCPAARGRAAHSSEAGVSLVGGHVISELGRR